jgi:HK97 family phage major capsid protein
MNEKELKELEAKLAEMGKTIDAKLTEFTTKAKAASADELKALKEEFNANVKTELEKELKKYNELNTKLQDQIDKLETKLQRQGFGVIRNSQKTFAEAVGEVLKSEAYKNLVNKKIRTGEMELKIDDMVGANTLTGNVVRPDLVPGIVMDPDRRDHVRSLIAQGTTSSSTVTYVQETAYNDSTDVTSEGAEKKQSDFDLALKTATVRKITSYLMFSEEMLADIEGLMSYISNRLPSRLALKEDYEILYGPGTGVHLSGIITNATAYSDNIADADITEIDVLVDACRQVRTHTGSGLAEYQATAIMIHPTDATKMKLQKDDNGNYIHPWIFMPSGQITLDGVPVFVTTAITAGQFLVGDFKLGAQIFDRRQPAIEISYENEDNFVKDMVTVRIFERIALCVYRPLAFIYGSFTAALAQGSA